MKKVFLFMAAFAALVSCVKEGPMTNETPDLEETPVVEEKIVSITAVGPEVADPNSKPQQQNSQSTKTQLIDGSNVMWSPGDVVKVCFLPKAFSDHTNSTKYGYNTNFTYNGTELSEAACFQGTWGPTKANLLNTDGFVVYPGNSDNFTFSAQTDDYAAVSFTIAYTLPTEQEAVEGSFDNGLNLSYAFINSNDVANNNAKVQFKNLCAIFRINLPSTEYNIKSIKLESEDKSNNYYLTGRKEFNLETTGLTGKDYSSASKPSYVLLKKADGSNLKPGESYYAVVWGQKHYCKGVKITFTNDQGNECVKVAGSGQWISTDPGKCITFNVKSLAFNVAPSLELNGDPNVVILAEGGTSNLGVIANNEWSVDTSNLPSWLTVTKDASMLYFTASKNTEPTAKSATLTIESAGLSKTITVTQPPIYYKISGSVVSKASDLENGAMYAIFFAGGSNSNQEQPYLWETNIYGDVSRIYFSNKSANLTNSQVFKFHKTTTLNGSWTTDGQSYKSASSGYLQSMYNNKYLVSTAISNAVLDFAAESTDQAVDLRLANQWSTDSVYGADIDVWITTSQTIYWTGSNLWYGGTGNTPRKWFFYKVVEN